MGSGNAYLHTYSTTVSSSVCSIQAIEEASKQAYYVNVPEIDLLSIRFLVCYQHKSIMYSQGTAILL